MRKLLWVVPFVVLAAAASSTVIGAQSDCTYTRAIICDGKIVCTTDPTDGSCVSCPQQT
jgi:hypothetical protein